MKATLRVSIILVFILCAFTQIVLGDIVVEKDVIGPGGIGMLAFGGLLLIAAAIIVIWAISYAVIKAVRNKNVNK